MTIGQLLERILAVADLSADERLKFKETFYNLIASKMLMALASADEGTYEKITNALNETETSADELTQVLNEAFTKPGVNQHITEIFDEISTELAEAVSRDVNNQERSRILASLD
jgi:hypothetical protein